MIDVRVRRRVGFPVNRYLFSPAHQLVYCPIPKNASTSLKLWFLQLVGEDPLERPDEVHDRVDERHTLADLSPRRARHVLERSLTFVVVRNPWVRVVSGYVDKFVKIPPTNHAARTTVERVRRQLGQEVHDVDHERGLTFREFVDHLGVTPDHRLNRHWRPQHCFLDGRRFDVEARFERLEPDMVALCDRLGVAAPVPRRNITPYVEAAASGALADVPAGTLRQLPRPPGLGDLLTPELCDRLTERYATDVTRFGYGDERPAT